MVFNNRSSLILSFALLLSFQPITANDWLEQLSSSPLAYPMIIPPLLIGVFFLGRISDSWETRTRKKELDESISENTKKAVQDALLPLQQKIELIDNNTKNIISINSKMNTLEEKVNGISIRIEPLLDVLNTSNSLWPKTIGDLTEVIRLLHKEALPEMELRITNQILTELKAVKDAQVALDSKEQILTLNTEITKLTRHLDTKLSTLFLCNNTYSKELKTEMEEATKNAKNALMLVEELRRERNLPNLNQPVLLYGTTKVEASFPQIKIKSSEAINQN